MKRNNSILIISISIIFLLIIQQIILNINNQKYKMDLLENSLYFINEAKKALEQQTQEILISEKKEYIVIDIESDKLEGYIAVLMTKVDDNINYRYYIMTTNNNYKICAVDSEKINIDLIEKGDCCKNAKENLEIEGNKYTIGHQLEIKD